MRGSIGGGAGAGKGSRARLMRDGADDNFVEGRSGACTGSSKNGSCDRGRHNTTSPHRESAIIANPFVHVELNTQNVAAAKTFYQSMFAWSLSDMEMGGGMTYTLIDVGEGTGGGMMQHPMPGAPSMWLPYVLVDDIVVATAKAKSLGATVVRDVMEVMDIGSLSIIIDPTGATLGLWQPKKK
jgi:hypothetical protein